MSVTSVHKQNTFTTPDGATLFEQNWRGEDAGSGSVFIVHGYGEHSGRYGHIAERLVREGYGVFAYDQRGHGRSAETLGAIPPIATLASDLHHFLAKWREAGLEGPVYIWGHSFGGLVLADYVLRYQPAVRGLVFSSAMVKVRDDLAPFLQKIIRFVAPIFPRLPVHRIDPKHISRDPEEVSAYEDDPLNYHGSVSARTGLEMLLATRNVQEHLAEITLPFLALHGDADEIVEPDASQLLFDRASSADKTLKMYAGDFHEVFNDYSRDQFMDDLVAWLRAHA